MKAKTIKNNFSFCGVGLHTGQNIKVDVRPSVVSGINFWVKGVKIPFHSDNVNSTILATTISLGDSSISTIEHFMSVVYMLGITSLDVLVDGEEMPIMDGSSLEFYKLFLGVGIEELICSVEESIIIKEKISVSDGESFIEISPADEFSIDYYMDYNHPLLSDIGFSCPINLESYLRNIVGARTFCFEKDIDMMKSQGLIKGGSLDNAVVITKDGTLNELRYPDEMVRHKILDIIGDISLLGRPLIGHISAHLSGHKLNIELVKRIQKSVYK